MKPGAGRRWLKNAILPLLVLAAGLVFSWAATEGSESALRAQDRTVFTHQADLLEAEVTRRLGRAQDGLTALRSTYAVAGRLETADLRRYLESRDFASDFPGLRGFGVIERVARDDLPAFVQRQRAAGTPGFEVRSSGERPDLLVIRSIEPLGQNRNALGFDSGSSPPAREALEQAIETGAATLTPPLTLQQDEHKGLGWVLYLPIYRGQPQTPQERREALAAVVFAPMVANEILGDAADFADGQVVFRLHDGTGERRLIFDGTAGRAATGCQSHALEHTILMGQRLLVLDVHSTGTLTERAGRVMPWTIALAGSGLSVFLAFVTWLLAAGKMQALAQASAMTRGMKRLAGIVERSAGAVFTTDAAGRITWVNHGFELITGLAQRDVLGRPVLEAVPVGDDMPARDLRQTRVRLRRGEPSRLELSGRRPDGAAYWTEVYVQPDLDVHGAVAGYVGMALDISLRKQAELQHQASEHLMRLIADNVPACISYWDRAGRCGFANQRMGEVYGLVPGQEQRAFAEVFGHGDDHVRQVLQGMPQQFEQTLVEAGGRESAWQVHYVPDLDGEEVKGFFVLAHEVTELKKARDLALAASQAKTRFLSNMSHEIRTPMNAVLGMLTLLRATSLSERQSDYAGKAEGAARALLSLLNDVLDFSKIEAGKMRLDCRPFSLETTFAELSVILSANVGSKEIEVLYDLDPRVPDRLVGDDMRLRQILINLGGNAVKFTSQGEVVVRTRLLEHAAGLATVEFSVEDSGIGMTPAQQARLFSDYAQATDQTARQFGGTGLGLGICRRLTEMMGSQIRLDSTPAVGSRFSFTLALPVADAAAPLAAPTIVQRVLIVDDNDLARETLAALAASQGWQVDTVRSGEAAIAAMAEACTGGPQYDAVFIDWRMPGLDGWEASLRIRALPARARTPMLVMVTAHGREMLGQRPAEEQALLDGFLVKPVTASMLREAVERATSRPQGSGPDGTLGQQPLAGLRLLLAEDNPVNQQIARELLGAQGARIDVVGDGQQAVDRIAAGERYDAVLMDMLMPVLDGLAATVCIRQGLRQTALPIIAMTANAMDTDRAECLAAGMNDHVSKPIVLSEVVETLLRHVQGRSTAALPPPPPAAAADTAPVLDRQEALERLGGDAGLYEQLLPMFRANLAQSGRDLQDALERVARDEVARLVHTIKGMAGNMGATLLARAAQQAEHQLRGGAAAADLDAVTRAIDATLAEIGE